MLNIANRLVQGGVAKQTITMAVRHKHIQGVPCRDPMPTGEKIVHVAFMITGILAIPAYVTFNLKHWSAK